MKIPLPNYTQMPNAVFDHMPAMKEAELRVTMAIVRHTFGWHREKAKLSLSRLMGLTGLSRQGVLNGIADGIKGGTIVQEPDGDSFTYRLLVDEVVNEVDQASQPSRPPLVNQVDHIKESIKESSKEKNMPAASASPLPTPFQAIQKAWETTKQKHEPGAIINWGKEGVAIKALLAKGWTPEQVVACAEVMYADAFYQGKSLSLQSVATQIAAKDVKARGGSSSQRIKSKAEWCLDKYTVSDPKMRPDLSPTRVQEEYEAYAASH